MLGFIKTDKDVGYYNAAVKIKTILLSLVTSLGNVLLPRMSYYAKQRETEAFQKTMETALNFTMLLAGPLVIYFIAFAGESIRFLAGTGYEGAVLAMQIITVAIVPNGLTGVLGVQVLTALEREQYVLYSVIVGACTDFLLNLAFIPVYGAAGAALATVIAEFAVLFVQLYYTRTLLNRIKHNLRGTVYILLSLLCGGIVYWIPIKKLESDFWKLFCSATVFFSVYGIGLLTVHEEMVWEILNGCLRKLGRKGREKG